MQKVPTFSKGGVHPDDKKVFSRSQSIERLPMPSELIVALSQHLGAPAKALKAKGDTVRKGEKIGESAGFISADVHSPVNGVIKEIRTGHARQQRPMRCVCDSSRCRTARPEKRNA